MRILSSWQRSGRGSGFGINDEDLCGRAPGDGGLGCGAGPREKGRISDFDPNKSRAGFDGSQGGVELV